MIGFSKMRFFTAVFALFSLTFAANADARLQDQRTLVVVWWQQSGEYKALAYQAYNAAKHAFMEAKAKPGARKAVVVDLDETMLDNSAYSGYQIKEGKLFNPSDFTRWVNARKSEAVPGAVDFNNFVLENGGEIFYVSNRKDDGEKAATIDDMRRLGFKGVTPERLYLKKDKSNKSPRFSEITARGNDIVLYVGDNLNDFGDATYKKSNADRSAFVHENKDEFGKKFIMLPNPSYGGFEEGLADGFYRKSADEQLMIREKVINEGAWDGK